MMRHIDDARLVIQQCFGRGVDRALLYADNLTPGFFDLSTREAGEVLQKFRNYGIRVAVVSSPEARASTRFGEMAAEEHRGPWVRFCENRADAVAWLDGLPEQPHR